NFDLRRLGPAWYTDPTNWQLAQTRIRLFECPSDNAAGDTATRGNRVAFHHFNYNAPTVPDTDDNTDGDAYILDPSNPTVFGHTNYAGCAGLAGRGTSKYWAQYEGIFTTRSATALARIPDGTSNTLLLGEAIG